MKQDMTGLRFGRLVVLRKNGATEQGKSLWECRCDCGQIKTIPRATLRRKRGTQSCGCLRYENRSVNQIRDLTGQRFGRLFVVGAGDPPIVNHQASWLCRCDCGKEKPICARSLVSGATQSCGCLRDERAKQLIKDRLALIKLPQGGAAKNALIHAYMRRAEDNGWEFSLSCAEFLALTQQPCYYCGREPAQIKVANKKANGVYIYNGVDRRDSGQGYTTGNTVACCKHCNLAKGTMNFNEFIEWIRAVAGRFPSEV